MVKDLRICVFVLALMMGGKVSAQGIEWSRDIVKIAPAGGYARVLRTGDDTLMAAFEDGRGNVAVTRTQDGFSWDSPRVVIPGFMYHCGEDSVYVNVANAEICLLSNGTLLCAGNYRPAGNGVYPFSIVLCSSEDGGATWSAPTILYQAGTSFRDGCWEPSFLELPSGEVHIYFADEGPYTASSEQQISFIRSSDGGHSWSEPAMVCFRPWHRDGMPVAAIFGDEIVVAIEDNADGRFKPYTVRSSIDNPWQVPVYDDSPCRSFALADSVDASVYMGAPYLIRLPGGHALLSYQTTEGIGEQWELSCMEVAVGDASARNFTSRSRPFGNSTGLWNSLALWDADTVVAVTTADLDGNGPAPWLRFGRIPTK